MTGILNTEQPQGPQGQQMQEPQQSTPQDQQDSPQDQFDKMAINALKIIHDTDVSDKLISRIKNDEDTVAAIGETSFEIMMRLDASAAENGIEFEFGIVAAGLNLIAGELINVCEAAGANPLSDEQKYQTFSYAISKYLDMAVKTGKITQEELVQATQELEASGQQEIPGGASPSGRQEPQQMPQQQAPMPQGGM